MADLAHPPRKPLPTRPAMFAPPSRQPSNATVSSSTLAATISRSSSARTATTMVGPPPPGYVARMRRQKATVWCDRAQAEDPREAHARRVAKQRALLEVQARGPTGGHSTGGGRSSTLASTGKIRHSSASKPTAFTTGTMVGAAVPLRLSANEIGAHSTHSHLEDDFGMITDMAAPSGAAAAAQRHKAADELRRRGSVDDRTSSMASVRLFVANPDLSD
ncbi:hypothetical protein LOZ05_000167 [Ophidiomyces ophidiicola]|nr:hypothetical protein LOZ14_000461 [Ophidiomyces ophidiicola]KAI2279760.1 hypothetical protein LOZ05_000167 [Ophidiomyces ophidiicola]